MTMIIGEHRRFETWVLLKAIDQLLTMDWETIKKGGEKAIQKWIDEQMHYRSCTILLIGLFRVHTSYATL